MVSRSALELNIESKRYHEERKDDFEAAALLVQRPAPVEYDESGSTDLARGWKLHGSAFGHVQRPSLVLEGGLPQ